MSRHPQNRSVQFSCSVVSDSLWPHELQHARPPCPSPTPGVYPNSCPLSQWCHPTISSSVVPFSSCPQSFPASGSFQMSQLFASGGQSIGVLASTSVLPMSTWDWSPLGWTQSQSILSVTFLEFCLYIANHITKDALECGYSVGLITMWVWWTVTNSVLCTHAHFSWFNPAMFTIYRWMWIHLPSVGECRSPFIYEKRTLWNKELRNWLPLLSALLFCISPKKQNLPQ